MTTLTGDREHVRKGATYPVAGYEATAEAAREAGGRNRLRAVWDGRPPRPPREGEYYLSGAIVEAWRARADLSQPFHIARLAVVELHQAYTIKRFINEEKETER